MALPKLNTPKYDLKIPSTGTEITYRPYLVREEKILMIAMESEDQKSMSKALLDIIESCTTDVKTSKLTMFDVEYIFAKLRTKSVGETSEVSVKCDKCEADNKTKVNLEEVSITGLPDTKVELTPTTGLVMKFPSMNDYTDIQNEESLSNVDTIFAIIISSIESIYDGDNLYQADAHTKLELTEFIESLNTAQFKLIQDFLDSSPQAFVNLKYKCEECGHDHDTQLKGMMNFFG